MRPAVASYILVEQVQPDINGVYHLHGWYERHPLYQRMGGGTASKLFFHHERNPDSRQNEWMLSTELPHFNTRADPCIQNPKGSNCVSFAIVDALSSSNTSINATDPGLKWSRSKECDEAPRVTELSLPQLQEARFVLTSQHYHGACVGDWHVGVSQQTSNEYGALLQSREQFDFAHGHPVYKMKTGFTDSQGKVEESLCRLTFANGSWHLWSRTGKKEELLFVRTSDDVFPFSFRLEAPKGFEKATAWLRCVPEASHLAQCNEAGVERATSICCAFHHFD